MNTRFLIPSRTDGKCKHVASCVAAGLIDAPSNPAEWPEWTDEETFAPTAQPSPPGEKKPEPKAEPALPAKLSGFSDSGIFHLYKDEEPIVKCTFTWKEDGSFQNKGVLQYAGQKVETRVNITPDKEGRWSKIEGVSRVGTFSWTRRSSFPKT